MSGENYQRPSQPMRDAVDEALSQPAPKLSLRQRLVAWLMSKVTGIEGQSGGTAGGYWGGITFWDVVKAAAARVGTRKP